QVRLGGDQRFQVGFQQAAQVGHAAVQRQVKVGPGVVGGGHQAVLPARKAPHVGVAAQQHGHPFGLHRRRHVPPQAVGKGQRRTFGNGFGGFRRAAGGGAVRQGLRAAARQQQRGAKQNKNAIHTG